MCEAGSRTLPHTLFISESPSHRLYRRPLLLCRALVYPLVIAIGEDAISTISGDTKPLAITHTLARRLDVSYCATVSIPFWETLGVVVDSLHSPHALWRRLLRGYLIVWRRTISGRHLAPTQPMQRPTARRTYVFGWNIAPSM